MMRSFLKLLIFSLAFSSCKKDEESQPLPPVSEVPQIEFISINKTAIQQLGDSLVFTISYLDGNGDIGFENADSAALFVTDTRFPLTHPYHLPPFTPAGTELAVQGALNIVLENIILKNSAANSETATFKIYLKDRAGNSSNEITSPEVTITQ